MKKILIGLMVFSAAVAFAQSDDFGSLFDDPSSSVIEEAATVDNPENAIFGDNPFMWSGDFYSTLGVKGGYRELAPSSDELADPTDRLIVDIKARLSFDARPDRNFRVFGKFSTEYPFVTKYKTLKDPSAPADPLTNPVETYSVNNIKIVELFSDFNWKEKVFFRFGKQNVGWGLSRFYQIADPLTVGVKDPTDLSVDLEGPMALKVALPLGVNNLYFYSVVKDSYLPEDINEASIRDLGVGVKADMMIPIPNNKLMGNAEFTIGSYFQRNLAPKAVAGLSTSIGDFQIFTDQAVSWGLDSYRLTDTVVTGGSGPFTYSTYETEKPDDGLFYSATVGTMYVNNDWHFTLYAEYMYNSAASNDPKYMEKWAGRYYAEQAGEPASLNFSDIFSYLSSHNTGFSISWSELFGTDKLSCQAVWLQNWVDLSGMVTPSITFAPIDHLSFETGMTVAWGKDRSEWVLKNSDAATQQPQRLTGYVSVKIGGGKF